MPIEKLPNDDRSRLSRIGAAGEDMPMTLKEACSVVYKDAITPASLMAEAHRGTLRVSKIGRAYFVTWRDLRDMWEARKVQPKANTSTSPAGKSNSKARSDASLFALRQALGAKHR